MFHYVLSRLNNKSLQIDKTCTILHEAMSHFWADEIMMLYVAASFESRPQLHGRLV